MTAVSNVISLKIKINAGILHFCVIFVSGRLSMIADVAKKHLRHLMTEARAAALRFVDVEKWGVSL
mgnify:FL=1